MAEWQGVALWKAATLYQDICLKNYILFEAKVQIYSLDTMIEHKWDEFLSKHKEFFSIHFFKSWVELDNFLPKITLVGCCLFS